MSHAKYSVSPFGTLFNDFLFNTSFQPKAQATLPAANIAKTDNGFRVELAIPGFEKDEIQAKIEQKRLVISAQKSEQSAEEGLSYQHREFVAKHFERSFRLPDTIDQDRVEAVYNNGILKIDLFVKPELQPSTKAIEIA
jgi:HSP20 family protein